MHTHSHTGVCSRVHTHAHTKFVFILCAECSLEFETPVVIRLPYYTTDNNLAVRYI